MLADRRTSAWRCMPAARIMQSGMICADSHYGFAISMALVPALTESRALGECSAAKLSTRIPVQNKNTDTPEAARIDLLSIRGMVREIDDCTSINCAREAWTWLRKTVRELFMTGPKSVARQPEVTPAVSAFR